MKSYLLIDIGNTAVKWAMFANARMEVLPSFASTSAGLVASFASVATKNSEISEVLLCSVQSAAFNAEMVQTLAQLMPNTPLHWINGQTPLPKFETAYASPKTLGADRILGCYGLAANAPSGVLVTFGTATTVDYWQNNTFMGGCIAPGLSMMQRSLNAGTAGLPLSELALPKQAWGENTAESIALGCIQAQVGLVAVQYAAYQTAFNTSNPLSDLPLFVAGGAADILLPNLTCVPRLKIQKSLENPILFGLSRLVT